MGISLNHFSIRTTDLAATRAFYVDLLGLPRVDVARLRTRVDLPDGVDVRGGKGRLLALKPITHAAALGAQKIILAGEHTLGVFGEPLKFGAR